MFKHFLLHRALNFWSYGSLSSASKEIFYWHTLAWLPVQLPVRREISISEPSQELAADRSLKLPLPRYICYIDEEHMNGLLFSPEFRLAFLPFPQLF